MSMWVHPPISDHALRVAEDEALVIPVLLYSIRQHELTRITPSKKSYSGTSIHCSLRWQR